MKPKILIFINSLQTGGSERVVSLLLQNLHNEFEIHLAMYTNIIEYEIPSEIKILDLKQPLNETKLKIFLKAPSIARRVVEYCRKHNINTSIAFLYRACYVNSLMKTRFGFKGYIVMCERTHQSAILSGYNWLLRQVTRNLIKHAYQQADLVLTNSYVMQSDLVRNLHIRTPTRVIYNPIDIEFILRECAKEPDFVFDNETFYFITIGGLRREKNQLLLVEAFFTMKKLPCKLIIIGRGTEEQKIRKKVEDLGISDKVIFSGFQKNPFKYLCRSDCFVLSSDVEGFPNVLLEALACGKPVISTDCFSGPRELLAPRSDIYHEALNQYEIGEFGILTPTNDLLNLAAAMRRMYEDLELRNTFASRARKRAAHFHVKDVKEFFHLAFSGR